jgi:large repetitive protein
VKSRKAQKRSLKSARKAQQQKRNVRQGFGNMETLEPRQLMAADARPWLDGLYYPPNAVNTAWLPKNLSYETFAARSAATYNWGTNSNSTGVMSGEGSGTTTNVLEVEPNNRLSEAQFLNLGTRPTNFSGVNISGSLMIGSPARPIYDEDFYAFDLRAGDILDARLISLSGGFQVSFLDSRGVELIGNDQPIFGAYPATSPLSQVVWPNSGLGEVHLAFVVPTTGRYYARVSDGSLSYTLALRAYRPVLEGTEVHTKQKLFLDFDGAFLRTEIFGATGTARLSPLSSFLQGWGLSPANENELIDKIIASFQNVFTGSAALPANGGNGYFTFSGLAGEFDIEVLNSRDHADPWGQANVSRIIIGGTIAQLGIPTIGIAQSIDVGNFDREESAVVLLDNIDSNFLALLPRAGNVSALDLIADSIGRVAAHEAGHFFGGWHTLNDNATPQIMDTGGTPDNIMGVGPDGIYGTRDDIPVHFGTDTYDPLASAISFGMQNSAVAMSRALSTGTVGGYINGFVYLDANQNRQRDTGESGLSNVFVYADLNGNGVRDANEPRTRSRADGSYTLAVRPGTVTIRQEAVTGFLRNAPTSGGYTLTVAANQTVQGYNFGNTLVEQAATGMKWHDLNGNGLYDVGEPPLAGVWFYIDLDNDGRIDIGEPSAKSGADGRFTLKFPGPGTYTIREVIEPGYIQTFPGPARNNSYVVTITGDPVIDAPNMTGLNFGNRFYVDYGDAPDSYGTLRSSNGAAHGYDPNLFLGFNWDADPDGRPSVRADGDDLSGIPDSDGNVINDEDGVILVRPLVRGRSDNQVALTVVNNTGTQAYVQAWIDFNGDGDFLDWGEQIATNLRVSTGTQIYTFAAPANAKLGQTYARVRLSTSPNVGPKGVAKDGEVEDYLVTIVDTLQIAVNDAYTVSRNSTLNVLDVTENDFKAPGQSLPIVSAGPSAAGGIVQISNNNTILYTPPSGFVGQDVFSYTVQTPSGETSTASVTVSVTLSFDQSIAVDDSFEVPTNAISYPLNVLANDIQGRSGAVSIISITQPNKGGQITIATGGQSLRYTPPRNMGDTEQFTYTIADASGATSSATVTLHTLPGAQVDDDVLIRLVATDLSGNAITAIPQGQDFRIDVYIDDLRNDKTPPQFISSPGVFSAYFDMLYSYQLVTTTPATSTQPPSDRFDFDVTFFNDYTNGTRGDASVPGLINDFGAFSARSAMSFSDPVKFASLKFKATSPGIASFKADPADDAPRTDVTLFNTPGTAVPLERVRYVGTTIEIVGDSVEFPQAVDDSFANAVPAGSIRYPLPVLANDLPGSTGNIRLVSVSQPNSGTAIISDNGTPNNTLDDLILYTPNTGFTGLDQFQYTIQDSRGIQSTATVSVRVGSTFTADVSYRLQLFKGDGSPLADGETLNVGEQFQLRGYVQDLRSAFGANRGIFAAYQDVLYSSTLVSTIPDPNSPFGFQVTFGPNYQRVLSADARTRGLINEIGAVQIDNNGAALGTGEHLLFTIPFVANRAGNASFIGDPADIRPLHDTLTFEPPAVVPLDRIRFGFDSVQIVGSSTGGSGEGFTNMTNAYDVNADGVVSPMDALLIINALNSGGSRNLGGGEGEQNKLYFDVNADGALSPLDALLVINYLNTRGAGEGEGAETLMAVLGSGALAPSGAATKVCDPVVTAPETLAAASGTSLTSASNVGPASSSALDLGFMDLAGDEEEDDLDSLLSQLAPEINSSWKRTWEF